MNTMADESDQALSPEVSNTPRSGWHDEKSFAENDMPTALISSSDAGIALGSVLELTLTGVASLPPSLSAVCERNAPLELALRWTVQESRNLNQTPPQSKKLSVPATASTNERWELPAEESVVRVELMPELLRPSTDVKNGSILLLHVSLTPRRASKTSAWSLRFCVAVDAAMLSKCRSDHAVRLETGLLDHDGSAAGVAALSLRCGLPTQLVLPPKMTTTHDPQPVIVRLQWIQLKWLVESNAANSIGMEVVLEAVVPGQEASRTVRSKPWKLLKADVDLSMETMVTLVAEDSHTQAIQLVLYRHSGKERAMRLAEALVWIPLLENATDRLVVIPMLDSTLKDSRSDEVPALWGELTVTATVLRREVENRSGELLPSAATSVLSGGVYAAELTDVEGILEIELVEAIVETQPAQDTDATTLTLDVQLRVPSSKWVAATSSVPPVGTKRSLRFKKESFSMAVQWATKERVIPTLNCALTLLVNGAGAVKGSLRGKKPTSGQANAKKARGSHCVQLPVLFTFPDEWTALEFPVYLTNEDDLATAPTLVRLRLRMKLVSVASTPSKPMGEVVPSHGSGHLTLSNARAGGVFLRAHRPHDTYAIVVEASSTEDKQSVGKQLMVSASADEKAVTWNRSVSCEVVKAQFSSILIVRLVRTHQVNAAVLSNTESNESMVDDEHGELLGTLTMPLPSDVLRQKHLVSFSLPFTAATSEDRGRPTAERSARKAGMISFDLQFVDDSPLNASRHASSSRLVLHRIVWTSTPPALALTVATTRTLVLQSALSIVGGESLNEVLWSHDTLDIQALKDQSGEYVADHAIRLTDAAVAKLLVATASKSILIVKLTSSGSSRDGEQVILGQAVAPIRGGWAAFAAQEQCKWHKVYAVGRRESGNPEAIGEIQLSVLQNQEGDGTDPAIRNTRHSDVSGWLYLEVMEAFWSDPSGSSTRKSAEAFVQIGQVRSSRKPQKTKPQWSVDGKWNWTGDGVITIAHVEGEGNGEDEKYALMLVVNHERLFEIATTVQVTDYAQRSKTSRAFEDWLTTPDHDAHIRLRISYVPAVTGSLKLNVYRVQSLLGSRTTDLSLQRIGLRGTIEPSAMTATSEAKDGDARWLQLLAGSQLVLPLDTSSDAFSSRAIPTVKIQLMGYSMGNHELCLGEGSIPIAHLHSSLAHPKPAVVTQWVTLHSRHDAATRVAVILMGFQFVRRNDAERPPALDAFASPEAWRGACSAVLTLWKKLFYLIDSDHNGRVDLTEFKELFISHAEVFTQTEDGTMLLRVLFPSQPQLADLTAIERLFDDMDVNGDKGIEWLEFVDFMQSKLLAMKPQQPVQVSPVVRPVEGVSTVQLPPTEPSSDPCSDAPARELRKKRREDPHSTNTNGSTTGGLASTLGADGKSSSKRLSVRQLSAANELRGNGSVPHKPGNASTPREETTQLQAKLASLQAMLDLEKQKSSRLQDELRTLRYANHQLQMQREREILEEKTKAQFLQQAIQSHEQALKERDLVRERHHTASIVLQSKVRMRLEQKKFQALRILRWNAAVRIQCAYRCCVASKLYKTLRAAEMWRRKRVASATRLQRFTRLHLRRKERLLHRQARELSAVLLQKFVRRWLAVRFKKRLLKATVEIQTWCRGRLAVHEAQRLRCSNDKLKHWMLGCVHRQRWCRQRVCVGRVQRWWRRANELRWVYVTQLEAAMCIQAVWRGHHNRQKLLRQVLISRQAKALVEDAPSDLMTAAMGDVLVEREAETIRQEPFSSDESQDELERDEDPSDDEKFNGEEAGGDESSPMETILGQSRDELEALERDTSPVIKPQEQAEESEPSSMGDHPVERMIAEGDTKRVSGAADESESPAAQVAVVLTALMDRVLASAKMEETVTSNASATAEQISEPPSTRPRDADDFLVGSSSCESTTGERIQEDVELVKSVPALCVKGSENDEEVTQLGGELVELIGQLQVNRDGQRAAIADTGEDVSQVLRELIDAVAHQKMEEENDVNRDPATELVWADGHDGDSVAAPEASTHLPTEEEDVESGPTASSIEVQALGDEDDLIGENDNEVEPLGPTDAVERDFSVNKEDLPTAKASHFTRETLFTDESEVAANQLFEPNSQGDEESVIETLDLHVHMQEVDVVDPGSSPTRIETESDQAADDRSVIPDEVDSHPVTETGDLPTTEASPCARDAACDEAAALAESSKVRAETKADGISEEIAKHLVDSTAHGEDETAVKPASDQGERLEGRDCLSMAPEKVASHAVDQERGLEDGVIPLTTDPNQEAVVAAFDVSDSDEDDTRECKSSRNMEGSEAADDLQFMADADAVTHIEDAELSEDDLLDQDSRLQSEREDSDQQLLMDFEELTQPASASTPG